MTAPSMQALAAGLSERRRTIFSEAHDRPNGDVRVWPFRDAKWIESAGLATRHVRVTNHSLRRERPYWLLTPLGLRLRQHLRAGGSDG